MTKTTFMEGLYDAAYLVYFGVNSQKYEFLTGAAQAWSWAESHNDFTLFGRPAPEGTEGTVFVEVTNHSHAVGEYVPPEPPKKRSWDHKVK